MQEVEKYRYGLGAIDPSVIRNDQADIVHMTFYIHLPTQADIDELKKELGEDEELGLTKIADRLEIIELPENLVHKVMSDENIEWGDKSNGTS